MSEICLACSQTYPPNGILFCDDCGMDKDIEQQQERERESMPKCGVCGWSFTGWAMKKHAYTPCGEEDSKAEARPYAPEKTINDIKREGEESE